MEHFDIQDPDFKRCADFHGHICPGLATGFVAAKVALKHLGQDRAEDEELVAVVETDNCGVDAIQVLTGCTFGKGNLIYKDHGKAVFTFFGRNSGQGIRVSVKPKSIAPSPRHVELMAKLREQTASEAEQKEFEQLHMARTREVLAGDPETLFEVRPATVKLPPKARVVASVACDACGEPTMSTKMVERDGRKLCRECAKQK